MGVATSFAKTRDRQCKSSCHRCAYLSAHRCLCTKLREHLCISLLVPTQQHPVCTYGSSCISCCLTCSSISIRCKGLMRSVANHCRAAVQHWHSSHAGNCNSTAAAADFHHDRHCQQMHEQQHGRCMQHMLMPVTCRASCNQWQAHLNSATIMYPLQSCCARHAAACAGSKRVQTTPSSPQSARTCLCCLL